MRRYTCKCDQKKGELYLNYSGNSLTQSLWELALKFLLSELLVIQTNYDSESHLGTKKVLRVISNSVLSGYLLMSCHCIKAVRNLVQLLLNRKHNERNVCENNK